MPRTSSTTYPKNKPILRLIVVGSSLTLLLLVACQSSASESAPSNTLPNATQATQPTPDDSVAPDTTNPVTNNTPRIIRAVAGGQGDILTSLDPARLSMSDPAGRDIIENLYTGLTRLASETNSVQPELAERWVISSDGLRWTFELRDDIMWTAFDPDLGTINTLRPVTASDIVFAIWRACQLGSNIPHASLLTVIKGCRQISQTDPSLITEEVLANTIRAVAISPTRLNIELEESNGHFLTLTALPIMRPIAPEAFAPAPDQAQWPAAGLIASSGRWVVAPNPIENQITLLANPFWPGGREGNIDEWQITFAGNRQNALAAWQSGQADYAHLPAAQQTDASFVQVQDRIAYLAFAIDQTPLEDARIRRALSAAIDRQHIVDQVLDGNGLPTTSFTPPGTIGSPSNSQPTQFDPDFAREQLAQAGYPGCQLFPRITVMTDRSPQSVALARAYIKMWQTTLNCNDTRFELRQDDLRQVLGFASTPLIADFQTRPHIYILTWQADYPDANNWLGDVLHCERGWLQLGRPCDNIDNLIERAARETNQDLRSILYAEIETILFAEDGLQPIAPIYINTLPIAINPTLSAAPDSTPPVAIGPTRYDRWRSTESVTQ